MRSTGRSDSTEKEQVVDFNKVRERRLEEKRRSTERIFFKDLLSVYSVTGNTEMRPVELIEVSEDGCAFQIPYSTEGTWPNDGDHLPLRLYFSRDMYLEIFVRIQNSRHSIAKEARYLRFGC